MAQSADEKRGYLRGYNRAVSRSSNRVRRVLEIARGYKAALSSGATSLCSACDRWTRGGPNCLWGHCRADFEYGADEARMWSDAPIGHQPQKICTHETFGCINWIPNADVRTSEQGVGPDRINGEPDARTLTQGV